jgi:transposase
VELTSPEEAIIKRIKRAKLFVFLRELRQRQLTPAGRAKLRERVGVEHPLAHVGHWQGRRARYRGQRKNLFDLRRCAVVHNLHIIARLPEQSDAA